ncbi:uncharacterized protein LOC131229118 [Magnolia sinica]|uniref:uncharacterized protein LOC131229118 n=1 Tax=Magnolia sinica TaxID=86752 RepID=UPI00265AECC6|nr:uncharacterized protein LOC131229118 [Magnolia sinica]
MYPSHVQALEKEGKTASLLHSIRKPAQKPWQRPATAPPQTRVYVVDPPGFRQLVQKLTGAPQFTARHRLGRVAPPPLDLLPSPPSLPPLEHDPQSESDRISPQLQLFFSSEPRTCTENSMPAVSPFGLSPSSSYSSWCSFPLLSPGTVASLEQSTVL